MVRSTKTRAKRACKKGQKTGKNKTSKTLRKTRKAQKGGRTTFLPQDIVNFGRGIGSNTNSLFNIYMGMEPPPNSYPTLGHPISK